MPLSRKLLITVSAVCLLPLAALAQTATPPAPGADAPASVVPGAAANPTAAATTAATAAAVPATAPVAAATPAPAAAAPVTHGELPALVEQILVENPDIVMKAAQKMREKQVADSKKQASQSLEQHKSDIYGDTTSPTIGDPKGDVTVVEFFDYHCGYCKQMMPSLQQLAKDDKKVRIIFREFPILSEDSVTASRAALAVNNIAKDKYFDFHMALMKTTGKFDEKAIMAAAKKVGINTDKLKTEMASNDITAQLDKNRELGESLGIRGTPALIVDDQLVPGAMPYDDLKKMIEQIRSGKKPDANG